MESLIGRDISKYHIVEQLGVGGMAVVYKAFDTSLERFVAIKFIRKDTIGEHYYDQVLQRFEREAKVLASLDHPNIVTIFEYGQFRGSPYLLEQYIPGGALHLERRPMPFAQAAKLLAPVARALEYAHRRGIIHRDIKPSNILMSDNGDPMLSDFGIAKILDASSMSAGDSFLTSTGMQIGTPEYMAPEQWQGKPTTQSDIYGLGVVLYELVTGRLPYTADTPAAVMIKQVTEPLPSPRQFVPDLPKELERIIFKALALKEEDRYTSMGEFAVAFERLAYGEGPRSPSPVQLFFERARRLAPEMPRQEAAGRAARENKPRPAREQKVQRRATILAEQEKKRSQAAERFHIPRPNRTHLAWMTGGGAGLAGLVLLGIWLVSAASGSVNPIQTDTATPTSSLAVDLSNRTDTPSANTPSTTPTSTATETVTPSATVTPRLTAVISHTPTQTPSPSSSPSATITPTLGFFPTATPTRKVKPTSDPGHNPPTSEPPTQEQPTQEQPTQEPPTPRPDTPRPP